MVRYLVRVVNRATADNPYCAGQTSFAYYGRNEKLLCHRGSRAKATDSAFEFDDAQVERHGFRREKDAKRSPYFWNPEKELFWKYEVTIVKYELKEETA